MSDAPIVDELRRMNRLLALVATKGLDARDAVVLLSRAGYSQPDAGAILGMSANAVKLTLRRVRRTSK